ncbi:MAG: hypothetical protein WDM92_07505, partial [Caulobacteraceae bacterium]
VFLINLPVGILSLILVSLFVDEPEAIRKDRKELLARGVRFDGVGMLLVALGLGCLEVTLDRGQRDDWFYSPFITSAAAISIVSLIALIPWEMTRKEPVVDRACSATATSPSAAPSWPWPGCWCSAAPRPSRSCCSRCSATPPPTPASP